MTDSSTAEQARELFFYSIVSGRIFRLKRAAARGGGLVGEVAGGIHKSSGYRRLRLGGKTCRAHRVAWLMVTGEWPKNEIDHIDGNKDNNAWHNLREVTPKLNQQNRRAPSTSNKAGALGVCWHKRDKRWQAAIQVDGKNVHIGYFKSRQDAAGAYIAAKRNLHEGCTI